MPVVMISFKFSRLAIRLAGKGVRSRMQTIAS